MYETIDIINALPEMKTGNELISDLTILPNYYKDICNENASVRLMALSNLYKIYLPSKMSLEIYSKLYLSLVHSLQKKSTSLAIQQRNQNYKAIRQQEYNSIIGGSDSFTIIGTSGIGKSSAINHAIELITRNGIIEIDRPCIKIIPCIVVQCPFDSSVKGLLLEILRKVDECLNSKYYQNALKIRATIDMLIGSVSQVALNHIGLLIVDEIQNVVNNKNGKSLVGCLTQLINNSGISICMVGTPESSTFFEQAMQLARRSLGLQYNVMEYNQFFYDCCTTLFSFQYVKNQTEITDSIIEWLYEHSSGVISVIVSLIHDAQEIAILNGKEILNLETLNEAYKQRLSMLHGYIEPQIIHKKQTSTTRKKSPIVPNTTKCIQSNTECSIVELSTKAKNENLDIVQLLKESMTIIEVSI